MGDKGIKSTTVNGQGLDIHIHPRIGIETTTRAETSMPTQNGSATQLKQLPSHHSPLTSNDAQVARDADRANHERAANLEKAKRQLFAASEDMAAELRDIERRRNRPFKKDP